MNPSLTSTRPSTSLSPPRPRLTPPPLLTSVGRPAHARPRLGLRVPVSAPRDERVHRHETENAHLGVHLEVIVERVVHGHELQRPHREGEEARDHAAHELLEETARKRGKLQCCVARSHEPNSALDGTHCVLQNQHINACSSTRRRLHRTTVSNHERSAPTVTQLDYSCNPKTRRGAAMHFSGCRLDVTV